MKHYILNPDHSIEAVDLDTWRNWFSSTDRQVALDEINGITISTVFVGVDENCLFETIVFDDHGDMDRYDTYAEAIEGHQKMLAKVRGTIS